MNPPLLICDIHTYNIHNANPPQVIGTTTGYTYRDTSSWTSGFFPSSLWLLYQRSLTRALKVPSAELLALARTWQAPLRANKDRTDTHDLGFMVGYPFGLDAALTGDKAARETVRDAAVSLSKRFNSVTKTIRSWGSLTDTGSFTVIIDNMMSASLVLGVPRIPDIPYSRYPIFPLHPLIYPISPSYPHITNTPP